MLRVGPVRASRSATAVTGDVADGGEQVDAGQPGAGDRPGGEAELAAAAEHVALLGGLVAQRTTSGRGGAGEVRGAVPAGERLLVGRGELPDRAGSCA